MGRMGKSGAQRRLAMRNKKTAPCPREAAHPYNQEQHQQRKDKGKQPEVEPVPPLPPKTPKKETTITKVWSLEKEDDILYHKAMHELFVMQEGTPPIEVQALKEYQLWHLSKANPSEYGRFLIEFKTADLDKWARIVSQDPCNQKLGVVLFQHGTNKTSFMRVVQQQQLQLRKKEFFLIQFRIKVNGKSLKLEGARPQFMFSWDLLGALDPKMEITTIEVLGPRDFRNGMLAIMYMRNEWTDNPPLPDRILQTDQTHEELKVLVAKHRAEDQPQIQAPQKQIPSDQKTAASLNGNGPKHDGPATAPSQHAASATQPSPHPPLQPSYHHTRTTTSTPAPAKDPVSNDDDEDDGFIKFDAE